MCLLAVRSRLYDHGVSGSDFPTSAEEFLSAIDNPRRRADAARVVEIMSGITGQPPTLWGSIIGFGSYHYRYATGREGDSLVVGVAPRKGALTLYGLVFYDDEPLLADLGEHTRGKGCVYIKNLDRIDQDVLSRLIRQAWERSAAAGFRYEASIDGSGA
jgi:hypothetical protein